MKKLFSSLLAVALLAAAGTSMAWWSDDDDYYGGPWGGDWNPCLLYTSDAADDEYYV